MRESDVHLRMPASAEAKTRRPMTRAGFTLIELFFVLAIITLIAAMLFPVFAGAREKARQSICTSNLQQLAMAFQQYAQDNDQTLFNPYYFGYCSDTGKSGFLGTSTLEPYLKNRPAYSTNSVWVCPEITRFSTVTLNSHNGWGAYYCTYTMNIFLNPRPKTHKRGGANRIAEPDLCYSSPADQEDQSLIWSQTREHLMAISAPKIKVPRGYLNRPIMLGIRLSDIESPSGTDLAYEGLVEDLYRDQFDTGYIGRTPREGDFTLDQGFWPTQELAETFFGRIRGYTLQPATAARHIGVNNYLFCDGHVKALSPKRYPYDIQHDPNNIWFARIGRSGQTIPPPGGPGC